MKKIQHEHIRRRRILIVGDLGGDPDLSRAHLEGNKPFKGNNLFVGLGVDQDNVDGSVLGELPGVGFRPFDELNGACVPD